MNGVKMTAGVIPDTDISSLCQSHTDTFLYLQNQADIHFYMYERVSEKKKSRKNKIKIVVDTNAVAY